MLIKVKKYLAQRHYRYLYVGIWNTIFGYAIGIVVYKAIIQVSNIVFVGILSNIISISMSFLAYKIIVFRTPGNWLREYMKCYVVYGIMAIFSIFLLWILVDNFQLNIWMAQGLVILATIVISYIGHKKFTFNSKIHEK